MKKVVVAFIGSAKPILYALLFLALGEDCACVHICVCVCVCVCVCLGSWAVAGGPGHDGVCNRHHGTRVRHCRQFLTLICLGLAVTVMFSTMGMALFKGKFHFCNDDTLDGSRGEVSLAVLSSKHAKRIVLPARACACIRKTRSSGRGSCAALILPWVCSTHFALRRYGGQEKELCASSVPLTRDDGVGRVLGSAQGTWRSKVACTWREFGIDRTLISTGICGRT